MSNLESKRLLAKPVNLEQLKEAARMAHRLWLPQSFVTFRAVSPQLVFVFFLCVTVVLLWLVAIDQAVAALAVFLCTFLGYLPQLKLLSKREGWIVDFDDAYLEPIGVKKQGSVRIDPVFHSLGCYTTFNSYGQGACFLLELRHAKKGPVAPICEFEIHADSRGIVNQEALQLLDACVQNIAQRLGVPRSGAPLPLEK